MRGKLRVIGLMMAICMIMMCFVTPVEAATAKTISKATITKIVDQTYTGSAVKPKLTVKYNGKTLKLGTDYTVKYTANINVGLAKATITGKGSYTGTKSITFKILPKGTTISSINSLIGGFKVNFKSISTKMKSKNITAYQIQYATNSNFTANKGLKLVKGYTKSNVTIDGLKENAKYYVRIRTIITVNNVNYCSKWSATKTITTEKEELTPPYRLYGTSFKDYEYTSKGLKLTWYKSIDKDFTSYVIEYHTDDDSNIKVIPKSETEITLLGVFDTAEVSISTMWTDGSDRVLSNNDHIRCINDKR